MEITIKNAVERSVFMGVGDIRQVVTITYVTGGGFTGTIEIEKPLPPREELLKRIEADAAGLESLMTGTHTV
jgi:hypothetical protein